jgi:hypothetical protein
MYVKLFGNVFRDTTELDAKSATTAKILVFP